jgi:beta-N-acetylhexosaminidase
VTWALGRFSLRERAGQLLLLGVPAGAPAAAIGAVRQFHPGGVFLRGRSSAGVTRLAVQIGRLQATADGLGPARLHVAADQEGGQVQALSGPGFEPVPAAVVQGRWDAGRLAARAGRWSSDLKRAGVTLNLAPVADTVSAGDRDRNPPIGQVGRHYGSTPEQVGVDVVVMVAAHRRAGVATTLKHFPGLGRVRANTDDSDRAVDPIASAQDPYLAPFRAGIQAGAEAVMISSARYPRLDADQPAVFSRSVITGLLRGGLGFGGLVLSDDLGAAAAVQSVSAGRRATLFVAAGGDLVLTTRSDDAGPMLDALVAQAEATPAFRAQVDAAVRRVLADKYRSGLLRCA